MPTTRANRVCEAKNRLLRKEGKKWCPKCQKAKRFEEFDKNGSYKPDGLSCYCKTCWWEYYQPKKWFKKYGITEADYKRMFKAQHGRCAICLKKETRGRGKHSLSVDHCHATNIVRGLLCRKCNLIVGHVEDPKVLAALVAYLARFSKKTRK